MYRQRVTYGSSSSELSVSEPSPVQEAAPRLTTRRRMAGFLRSHRGATAAAVAIVVLLGAFIVTNLRISDRPGLSANEVDGMINQRVSAAVSQLQPPASVAGAVYRAAEYGIVTIQSIHRGAPGSDELGTGVLIDNRGDILTALHVVQGASSIRISFADGTVASGSVAGSDADDDIAVLTPSRLPSVMSPEVLGSGPQVGDPIFVVGNPLGLESSLTAGVVSGLDRSFTLAPGRRMSGMIQFDAAVNPGSSGGPLLNAKGQVIGIVTGLVNPAGTDSFAGIGFAVPIATAGQSAGAPSK